MKNLTVIDFFCGAGGFSEGFRQQGFSIVQGFDCWEPAVKTFNYNFGLNGKAKNLLDFQMSIEEIEALPDTDVILGSPPCVTFSSSNISGKADKTSGITLTQIFLRIVAVKRWKKGSILKAWFMENVPSSIKHLGKEYTFEELGLGEWAVQNKIGKSKVAIKLEGNQFIINSADYGSAQIRKRAISGEIIKKKKFVVPTCTHVAEPEQSDTWRTLQDIKETLPKITSKKSTRRIVDPNYPTLVLPLDNLTDHFYDTGMYEAEWRQARFLKTNHPYMGKMSFPEDESRPSRTVTATKIGTSREAIIYKSEYSRQGDGEFRTATVREAACIMGFPITYQFVGGETTKWRLVGNAVCPSVSRNLAKQLRKELGLPDIKAPVLCNAPNLEGINNLNTFSEKKFKTTPPRKNKNSRFRRHPFKDGNLTITLSNYDIAKNNSPAGEWLASVQYGTGEGFFSYTCKSGFYKKLEAIISEFEGGKEFLYKVNNGFSEKIARAQDLQEMYEMQINRGRFLEPTRLVEELALMINQIGFKEPNYVHNLDSVFKKKLVPKKQLLALYAINKIASRINGDKP